MLPRRSKQAVTSRLGFLPFVSSTRRLIPLLTPNPSRRYLPPPRLWMASLSRIREVVIKRWSLTWSHVMRSGEIRQDPSLSSSPPIQSCLPHYKHRGSGPCCHSVPAIRWEDGGMWPSLGEKPLVMDSWGVNGAFVCVSWWTGVLPPHISVYACDRRANAVMRKRDEPGPNQNWEVCLFLESQRGASCSLPLAWQKVLFYFPTNRTH